MIWEKTVEPRTVDARYQFRQGVDHVISSTPVPGALQACHEARSYLSSRYYQRAFTGGCEPRYVWVNFDIDMISIGALDLNPYQAECLLICRLKISAEYDKWFFVFGRHELAETFLGLEELHIICEAGLRDWQSSWRYGPWPCPRENVTFIDKKTGKVVVGNDYGRMVEEGSWDESMSE